MERCYVRIWNSAGDRVFGWLGNSNGYAACVPAGLYSNPRHTPGAIRALLLPAATAGDYILATKGADGDLGLGGTGSGGVAGYWHPIEKAYPLRLVATPGRKLASPVPGNQSGALAHARDGGSYALHSWYTINNDVFGMNFLNAPEQQGQLFSKADVKLEFTTTELVFEFVPASAFSYGKPDYVPPNLSIRHWQRERWMGDLAPLIGDRPLADLVIPGSHDATSVDFDIEDGNRRSRTQSRSIYEQLKMGSRYLDLRFKPYYGSQWFGNHGGDLNNMEITTVLADINRFLDENPSEILMISLLPTSSGLVSTDPIGLWDIVLNGLAPRIFPRCFTGDANGVTTEYYHFIENATTSALAALRKNILLFSWGRPPAGTVEKDGPMKGQWRDYHIWAETPEKPTLTAGAKPWEAEFAAAHGEGYDIDFDSCGVWLNSYSTTAHDLRLVVDAVQPPAKKPWLLHCNAPATAGFLDESILAKATRIQPPLAKLVREDPSMVAKLNVVNLDFVGDYELIDCLIQANLMRQEGAASAAAP